VVVWGGGQRLVSAPYRRGPEQKAQAAAVRDAPGRSNTFMLHRWTHFFTRTTSDMFLPN